MGDLFFTDRLKRACGALILFSLASAGLLAAGFAALLFFYRQDLPNGKEILAALSDDKLPQSSEVYDRNGVKIGEFASERRFYVRLERLPKRVIQAFLSAEDKGFYEHPGYSFSGMIRAAIANVQKRKAAQGASTITQQLARIYFLSRQKSFERKIKEIFLAIEIERTLSKDKILELYLNKIYLGKGSYGVEAGARNYFHKSAAELTIGEAALLAGLPQAPSRLAPHRNLKAALKRRDLILERMAENRFITAHQAVVEAARPVSVHSEPEAFRDRAPYFVEMVRNEFQRKFEHWRPQTTGLRIRTSLDRGMQQAAESLMQRSLQRLREKANGANPMNPSFRAADIEGALALVDPASGGILAVQGGSDFDATQFNRAVKTKRPMAELMFPLTAATAYQHGYTPGSAFASDPYHIEKAASVQDGSVARMVESGSVEDAFRLYSNLGAELVHQLTGRCGIAFRSDSLVSGLGMGQATPLRLSSCYSSFINRGMRHPTFVIEEIRSREGEVLYRRSKPQPVKVMSPAAAFFGLHTLQGSFRSLAAMDTRMPVGSGAAAAHSGGIAAVSDDLQNIWFAGLMPGLSSVMWFGSNSGKSRTAVSKQEGKVIALRIYQDLAALLKRDSNFARQRLWPAAPAGVSFERMRISQNSDQVRLLPFFGGDSFHRDSARF